MTGSTQYEDVRFNGWTDDEMCALGFDPEERWLKKQRNTKGERTLRDMARTKGRKTYTAGPRHCGCTEFYTVNGSCVECAKRRARARYATPEGRRAQREGDARRYSLRRVKQNPLVENVRKSLEKMLGREVEIVVAGKRRASSGRLTK
jgi:hypothetical protein